MKTDSTDDIMRRALAARRASAAEVVTSLESFRDFAAEVIKIAAPGSLITAMDRQSISIRHARTDAIKHLSVSRMLGTVETWRLQDDLRSFVRAVGALSAPTVSTAPAAIGDELSKVVPLLKTRQYAERNAGVVAAYAVRGGRDPFEHAKIAWDTDIGLVAFAVVNDPDKFTFITRDRLEGSGLGDADIQAAAMINLRSAFEAMGDQGDYSEGIKEISGVGGIASSLLLLDDFLEREAALAQDAIVIFSGGPDHLFLVPASNAEFIDYMAGRIGSGTLRLGDIPPLLYADDQIELLAIERVNAPDGDLPEQALHA